MGREVPKTFKTSPSAHFFFDNRAADGRKHNAKMRVLEISKNTHFCDVSFSLGKKHIVVKPCLKQHAFLVDPLGDSFDVLQTHTLTLLFTTQKGGPIQEKGSKFRTQDLPKWAHSDRKKRPKRSPFRVWCDAGKKQIRAVRASFGPHLTTDSEEINSRREHRCMAALM